MVRMERKLASVERVARSRPTPAPARGLQGHAALVASAQASFGNRAVGAVLRGEGRDGPEAVLHAALAFAAAGIQVGDDVGAATSNAAMAEMVRRPPVSRAARPGAPSLATNAVDHAACTSGSPLPDGVRADMEARFGASFADVRVHTDGAAARAADAVSAHAYTVGSHIWFGAGEARFADPVGLELLAHELTHVLQNREGPAPSGGETVDGVAVSSPNDAREREAVATARAVMREPAPESTTAHSPAFPPHVGQRLDHAFGAGDGALDADAFAYGAQAFFGPDPGDDLDAGCAADRTNGAARGGESVTRGSANPPSTAPGVVRTEGEHGASWSGTGAGESHGETALSPRGSDASPAPQDGPGSPLSRAEVDGDHASAEDRRSGARTAAQEALLDEVRARLGAVRKVTAPAAQPAPATPSPEVPEAEAPAPVVAPVVPQVEEPPGSTENGVCGDGGGTVAGGGGATPRDLDGLVDHYMATHWDQSVLATTTQAFGVYPEAIASELDHWLPLDVSAGQRGAANFVAAMGAGLLDSFFLGFASSIPGVGLIFTALGGLRDIFEDATAYLDNDDVAGAVLVALRHGLATVGGLAGDFGDLCTAVQDTAHVLAPLVGGISEVVGVPVAVMGTNSQAVAAWCGTVLATFDGVLLAYDFAQANQSELDGNFARAAFFRDQARGDVVNVVSSVIKVIFAGASAATAAVAPGGAPSNFAEMMRRTGRDFLDNVLGLKGDKLSETVTNVIDQAADPVDSLATLFQEVNNGLANVGLGDAMKRDDSGAGGGYYIQQEGLAVDGTDAAAALGAARQATFSRLTAEWAALEGEPPLWHQEVVNTILDPQGGSWFLEQLNGAIAPSEWIRMHFARLRWLMTVAGDAGLDGASVAADLAASALDGIARPLIESVNTWIADNKPQLDEWVTELDEKLAAQQLSLETLREMVAQAEGMVATLQGWNESGEGLDDLIDPMITTVTGVRVSPELLGIPEWVPPELYASAIEALNANLEQGLAMAQALKQQVEDDVRARIREMLEWAEAWLEQAEAALAEGGEAETMLQAELAQVQDLVHQGAEAFVAWDGVLALDFDGGVAWLKEVAAEAQEMTSDGRQARWLVFIETTAQPYVDAWKARHEVQVRDHFYPDMPAEELAAIDLVLEVLRANYSRAADDRANPDRGEALERLQSLAVLRATFDGLRGAKGRPAIQALWRAEVRLAGMAAVPLSSDPR